jgi:hypothetical protein
MSPPTPSLLTTTTIKHIFEKKLSNHIRPVHTADTLLQFMNLKNNKPLNHLKYALAN